MENVFTTFFDLSKKGQENSVNCANCVNCVKPLNYQTLPSKNETEEREGYYESTARPVGKSRITSTRPGLNQYKTPITKMLQHVAMIFAVLVMSMANVGMAWADDPIKCTPTLISGGAITYEYTGGNKTSIKDKGLWVEVPSASAEGQISIMCGDNQASRYAYIYGTNGTVKDNDRKIVMQKTTYPDPIFFTSSDIKTDGGKYYLVFNTGDEFKYSQVKFTLFTKAKYTTSTFYPLYANTSKTAAQLVTAASFHSNIETNITNVGNASGFSSTVESPHDFKSNISSGTTYYYLAPNANTYTITLYGLSNVKSIRLYGNGNGGGRTYNVTVKKVSGSGSTFSVSSLTTGNAKTILEYTTGDMTGEDGYDANTYYTYTLSYTGNASYLWGIYVEAAPASGCPYYSFHTGGDDVQTNNTQSCFVNYTSTEEWQLRDYTIPADTKFFVGNRGYWYNSDLGNNHSKSVAKTWAEEMYLARSFDSGDAGGSPKLGQATGATGTIRIYDNSNWNNLNAAFIPDGYVLKVGSNEHAFAFLSSNEYRTDIVEINSTTYDDAISVGVKNSSNGYVATANSQELRHIFFVPSPQWKSSNAKFCIHYWGAGDSRIGFMSEVPGKSGWYEGWLPSGATGFQFERQNPAGSVPSSDNRWTAGDNQTLQDGKNCYTMTATGESWDGTITTSLYSASGKYRIWDNSKSINWYVTFVPYYVLRYNANDGSNAPAQQSIETTASPCQLTVAAGSGMTAPTGYQFLGWNPNESQADAGTKDDSYDPSDNVELTGDVTLYAVWNCITPDAPTASAITATDGCGAAATFSAEIPSLPSYVTWYWQTSADGTSTSNPASTDYTTDAAAGSKTIYLRAKNTVCDTWSEAATKSATVRTAVTATWSTAPADGTVGGGMTASVTTNYSAGLRFSSSDATVASVNETSGAISYLKAGTTTITATVTGAGSYCSTASVNKTITVTAAAAYTVTYDANGGSGSVPTDGNTYAEGDSALVKEPGALTRTNYTFVGWNDKADGSGTYSSPGARVKLSGDKTFYAVWRDASGTTCPDGSSEGTVFALSMKTNTNSKELGLGESVLLGSTYTATLTNGNASLTDVAVRTDGRGTTKAKITKGGSGKKDNIQFGGADAMLTLYFDCALAQGDVITVTGADLAITTTPTRATTIKTSSNTLTIPSGSPLIGKRIIYLWRKDGTTVNVTGITITRPASCTSVAAPTALTCSAQTSSSLTFTWTKAANASTYTATLYNDDECTSEVASQDLGNVATVTFSELSASTTYYCKVQSHGDGSTYCAEGGITDAESGTTTAAASLYTVTYAYNGATGGASPASATGASVTLPTPTRTGYELDGWYKTDGTKVSSPSYTPTADITLYARWQETCDAEGVAKSTTDVAASGYTTYQEVGGSNVVFTNTPTLGFKYKDAAGNPINSSTTEKTRNNAYSCLIKSSSSNKGAIKTNNAYSNVDSISFYFAGSDKAGCKVAVWCSTDDFSADSTQLLPATAVASPNSNKEFTRKVIAIPSGQKASALRFKFRFTADGSGKTCYIDSLKVYSSTSGGGTCYHVYYHGNGAESGFVSDTTSYADGAKATVLSYNDSRYPLTKDGYDFQGWATSAGGSVAYSAGEKITIDGADVALHAVWVAESDALVTWKMNTATDEAWATTTGTGTTDVTNITSISTAHDEGDNKAKNSATAKTALASSASNVDKGADFTFAIGSTKQVEINKLDCQVFNVGDDNDGQTTYKAQISDAAGNVYTSTNSVCPANDATLTDASFVFGSGKILRGAVTIRVYGWVSGSGSWTDFRMGPDVKFYGTVEDYVCATPAAPTISGVSEYVPGQDITLTASHDGTNYDNLTTYTWYKGTDWATASAASPVQAAATREGGYTLTIDDCTTGNAGLYWCKVSNGTGCDAHNSEGYNIIVYPTYTITYNLNGGTNPVDPAPKTSYTQFDEDYTLPTPTRTGYVFAGWYGASDFSGLPTVVLGAGSVGNKEYYAKWGASVTVSWTVTKRDDKLYRGGGGYSVKAVINETDWSTGFMDELELTATEGVTLKNIVASVVSSHVQVTADFDITTGLAADATKITFTLDVPAAGTYGPRVDEHEEDLTSCAGGSTTITIFDGATMSDKTDADDISYKSGTEYTDGTTGFKYKCAGFKKDLVDVTEYTNHGSYSNAMKYGGNSTSYYISMTIPTGYTGSMEIVYGSTDKTRYFAFGTSNSSAANGSNGTKWNATTAAATTLYSATIDDLAAGTYYLLATGDKAIVAKIAMTLYATGGGITPTLTWDDGDADIANDGVSKSTSNDDFVYTASQDKNSLGAITYSSSDATVATVNATTGQVHLVGAAGTATITATIAASGCFSSANVSYTITVTDDCDDEAGTITTEDLGCSGIKMTVTGHTAAADVSYQWYKVGTPSDAAVGENQDNFTATEAGSYYVIVTNTGDRHCAKRSTNTVTVEAKAAATATKIVDSWYVKNGRRTPDIELVKTTNATSFTVTSGSSTIWESAGSTKTGFGGCGFHMDDNGIIYLNGTTDAGAATSGLTGGEDETLTITAIGCGGNASQNITIHKQAATDYKEIAFVADGGKGMKKDSITVGHGDGTELYEYLDSVTAAGNRLFQLSERNIYWTTDEKAIREEYSQFDGILITDDPSTNTVVKKGDDYKTKGYVNAFGTMVDVRPIFTMEAYVSALNNWGAKGIAGNPESPNPRQYEMRLECKDHEIYGAGLPTPEDGTNVWEETIGGETFRHVILVDSTKGIYNGVKYNKETKGNEKPALQGFTGEAAGSLLGLGRILEGTLQAAIERQEEPAARLLVMGINAKALQPTCALTNEGKTVIKNILIYLLKTNMEEVDDCSNYFTGKNSSDWNNASNWSKNQLPSSEAKVRILAPCMISGIQPHVAQVAIVSSGESSIRGTNRNGDKTCDGRLTINADGALIVDGKVLAAQAPHFAANNLMPTTPEDLIINTNGSAQAALIFDNEEAKTKATVKYYSLGRKIGSAYQFQYFAVPMEYVDVNPAFAGSGIYTYVWHENGGWERRGYYTELYAFEGVGITTRFNEASHNYTMKGTLASTAEREVTLTNDAETDAAGKGDNIIGNSWMAPINIASLKTAIGEDSNIEKAVYIYCTGNDNADGNEDVDAGSTETAGQWLAIPIDASGWSGWEGLKVIPAMQAFLIHANTETTLTLNYKDHVRSTALDKLNEPLRAPHRTEARSDDFTGMRMRVSDSQTHADLYLFEGERFSADYDNGWEAKYMEGDGRSAQFYAMNGEDKMAVMATNELEGTPVCFAPGKESNYTISFFGGEGTYYLNDLKEEQSTAIEQGNTYSFTYEQGDMPHRFLISTTPFGIPSVTTGCGGVEAQEKVQKIIYNDHVYIIRGGKIYDVMGKMMK